MIQTRPDPLLPALIRTVAHKHRALEAILAAARSHERLPTRPARRELLRIVERVREIAEGVL